MHLLLFLFVDVRIFENAIDKDKVKCKLQSRPNYFSVHIYVLSTVIRQQFCQVFKICQRNTVISMKTHRKVNRTRLCMTFQLLFITCTKL